MDVKGYEYNIVLVVRPVPSPSTKEFCPTSGDATWHGIRSSRSASGGPTPGRHVAVDRRARAQSNSRELVLRRSDGAGAQNMLSPLPRLVPATGIFALPFRNWCPLRVYSLSSSVIGARYGYILSPLTTPRSRNQCVSAARAPPGDRARHGPIRRRKRGYILMTDQSDTRNPTAGLDMDTVEWTVKDLTKLSYYSRED
eukprot:1190077-Prorocentrum_minimum.AAC.1